MTYTYPQPLGDGDQALTYGSVCSGIEAATVAWHPLGWQPVWFAEIEPFPSAVLAHHYPQVPNLGDMTTLAARILAEEIPAPDVLTGGTPCQAFSVAGLRESLDDARGQLTLAFVHLLNAIDQVRARHGQPPAVCIWENVPGVYTTNDNAFGCFLGGLAGEDGPLEPPGGKWSHAGLVHGPQRAVAWRTLDAQYFGVAQRRQRCWLVASARHGFDPAAVLFESQGLRRDSAPSRGEGQGAAGTAEAGAGGEGGDSCHPVAPTLDASAVGFRNTGDKKGQDPVIAFHPTQDPISSVDDTTHAMGCGSKGGAATVAIAFEPRYGARPNAGGAPEVDLLPALRSATNGGDSSPCVAFAKVHKPMSVTDAERWAPTETAPTQTHWGRDRSDGGTDVAVIQGVDLFNQALTGDQHCPLRTAGGHGAPAVLEPAVALCEGAHGVTEVSAVPTLQSQGGGKPGQGYHAVRCGMAVRRLTPTECERLMGFPDGYTLIPWKKKPAADCPDGPRYKALGNSWAVPCARWVGARVGWHLDPEAYGGEPLTLNDLWSADHLTPYGAEASAPTTE